MVNLLPQSLEPQFMTFFFVLMRVGAAVFTMPVVGSRSIPRSIRAAIAFWMALVIAGPYIGLNPVNADFGIPPATRLYNGVVDFTLIAVSEFLIGLALGFIFQALISAIGLTGEVIGKQAGFSAASVFDPITGQDNFLLAQIKVWFGTLLFLIIGGPEMVLQMVAQSFHVIAPGEGYSMAALGNASFYTIIFDDGRHQALMSLVYIMGLRLALPMIGGMLLVSLAEAFIARTAPQLNIMSVGFAIRMSMALFILTNVIAYTIHVFKPHLQLYTKFAEAFVGRLAPP